MAATAALDHSWPTDALLDAHGVLQLAGCDVRALAAEHGTPLLVLSEQDIRARARAYVQALSRQHSGPGRVLYAMKALPVGAIVQLVAAEGCGVLAASGGELELALRAGVDPRRIALHGNAKGEGEIAAAVAAGAGFVVIDNIADADKLARVLGDRTQDVLVRVTPGVETDTHAAIMTGQDESKFGVALSDVPAVLDALQAIEGVTVRGLHAHIGSQLLDVGPYRDTARAMAAVGRRFDVFDLGGGLGTAYVDEHPPAIEDHVHAVVHAATDLLDADATTTLLLEPGRALVANAGVTLYRIESVKRNVHTWVAVDGGMSDNLRPMLYGARHQAQIADRFCRDQEDGEGCRVAGKHCESGDVLAQYARLREPAVGDLLAMSATGAYAYPMSSNYNCVPRPGVVVVNDGRARIAVRRETYDDLFARDEAV